MKLTLYVWTRDDWETCHELYVDGEHFRTVTGFEGCGEDAIIGRDLIDCHDIISYMRIGYAAAKDGKEIEVEIIESQPPGW